MKNEKPRDPSTIGDPIGWTDEQLEQLSQVSPADLQQAIVRWHIEATPRFKSLLNADRDRTDDAATKQQ